VGKDGNQINHSGDSMLIDPIGTVLFTNQQEELIQSFELKKDALNDTRSQFPFWKDADQFNIIQDDPHA
jgi:predicted amidohydrolase